MADERIEDSQEYKIAENGQRMKKVKDEDGNWTWVLDVALDVIGVVVDIVT